MDFKVLYKQKIEGELNIMVSEGFKEAVDHIMIPKPQVEESDSQESQIEHVPAQENAQVPTQV